MKKLESIRDPRFHTLENEEMRKILGGDGTITRASIYTFDGSGGGHWDDNLSNDDGPISPILQT
jgi:hypothetical protein